MSEVFVFVTFSHLNSLLSQAAGNTIIFSIRKTNFNSNLMHD